VWRNRKERRELPQPDDKVAVPAATIGWISIPGHVAADPRRVPGDRPIEHRLM